jgi:hypothetical protein
VARTVFQKNTFILYAYLMENITYNSRLFKLLIFTQQTKLLNRGEEPRQFLWWSRRRRKGYTLPPCRLQGCSWDLESIWGTCLHVIFGRSRRRYSIICLPSVFEGWRGHRRHHIPHMAPRVTLRDVEGLEAVFGVKHCHGWLAMWHRRRKL